MGKMGSGFPLLYPAAIRPDVALSGEAGKHSSGVAFAGKNAIAPPDPTPDTIRRCGTFRQKIFPPVQSGVAFGTARSEEHTSELTSLMRNSYAVFCLKYNI